MPLAVRRRGDGGDGDVMPVGVGTAAEEAGTGRDAAAVVTRQMAERVFRLRRFSEKTL